jgi:predicted small secreted protein
MRRARTIFGGLPTIALFFGGMMRIVTSVVVACAFALAGCSDGASSGTGGAGGSGGTAVEDDPCLEIIDQCLVNQQACVVDGGEPNCVSCGVGEYPSKDGGCAAIEGETVSHTFPDNTTPAGSEIVGMCRSWTMNNPEPLWVNAVEIEQTESSHHSNWMFVPDTDYDGPDGLWPCADRGYSQLSAALAGGVVYAQSTQATHEVQKFPDGAAYRIPANARIISDIHTLNTSNEEITGNMTLTLYTVDPAGVSINLVPFHVDFHELTIPPMATSRFTGECDLRSAYGGGPLDLQIYYVLPHTHALGTRMFVEGLGGELDGATVIDVTGFNGEARGRAFDPPIDMGAAHGLRFGCEFDNPTAEEVNWGFDDQEMCEALGFAATPVAFESRVSEAIVGAKDGAVHTFTGECQTAAFPWDKFD